MEDYSTMPTEELRALMQETRQKLQEACDRGDQAEVDRLDEQVDEMKWELRTRPDRLKLR
jgi:uncharacterized membrane protein (DUF106 family)